MPIISCFFQPFSLITVSFICFDFIFSLNGVCVCVCKMLRAYVSVWKVGVKWQSTYTPSHTACTQHADSMHTAWKVTVKRIHRNAVAYSMRRTWSAQVMLVALRVHGSCVRFLLNAQLKKAILRSPGCEGSSASSMRSHKVKQSRIVCRSCITLILVCRGPE